MTDVRGSGNVGGMNARPQDDTLAGTGPGLPDDALAPGEADPVEAAGERDDAASRALEARLRAEAEDFRHRRAGGGRRGGGAGVAAALALGGLAALAAVAWARLARRAPDLEARTRVRLLPPPG
jgi:hypothetical protein